MADEYSVESGHESVAVVEQPLIKQNTDGKLLINLPTEKEQVLSLVSELLAYTAVKGVPGLITKANKYLDHIRLMEDFHSKMQTSVRYLSGSKASHGPMNTETKARKVAVAFYNSLNEAMLKKQCALFKLNYNYYENREAVVQALVNASIEMVGGEE